MTDLVWMPIAQLRALISAREVSPVELVRAYLDRISALDGKLRAYVTVCAEEALAAARRAEADAVAGRGRGPLHGIPLGLKDLVATKGIRTTAGSKILGNWIPDRDATVAERLSAAGGILLGKLNMHEFAFGPEGLNPTYGDAWNPWDARTHRISGGSSSGSAVAVAAALAAGTLGSDTGGSIRLPSALCNVTGLKPTYGRVSRAGVVPLAWSLDHVGPMTRTAADAALLLQAIAGRDSRDPTTSAESVPDYTAALTGNARGLRVGLLRGFFVEDVDPEVLAAVAAASRSFAGLGATVEDVELEIVRHGAGIQLPICWAEAFSYHEEWLRTRPDDYEPRVRERLKLGALLSAAEYLKAQRAREILRAGINEALAHYDILVCPTTPVTANPIGEDEVVVGGARAGRRLTLVRFTQVFNATGHPVMSVPCGFSSAGLPIGMQLVARDFDEATLLRAADAYQRATEWHERRPPVVLWES